MQNPFCFELTLFNTLQKKVIRGDIQIENKTKIDDFSGPYMHLYMYYYMDGWFDVGMDLYTP